MEAESLELKLSFGELLEKYIKEREISITELAARVNRDRGMIYRYIDDQIHHPPSEVVADIADELELSEAEKFALFDAAGWVYRGETVESFEIPANGWFGQLPADGNLRHMKYVPSGPGGATIIFHAAPDGRSRSEEEVLKWEEQSGLSLRDRLSLWWGVHALDFIYGMIAGEVFQIAVYFGLAFLVKRRRR